MNIKEILVGKEAKADHPITIANPTETFTIVDAKIEERGGEFIILVRGENTCWFGRNYWSLVA
jgi:hypothetical protein